MIDLNRDADREQLLSFYQMKTLRPESYAKDTIVSFLDKDYSDEPASSIPKQIVNKLLSESTLGATTRISDVARSHTRTSADFKDALGFSDNIKELLLDLDVIEDTRDPQLHKFMVDSKSFNPKVFLSTIHAEKSLNDLKRGIQYLDRDIEAKKPELQQLISANFEKTLSAKNSLDTVFTEYGRANLTSKLEQLETELAFSSNSANQLLNPVLLQITKENQIANALKQIEENKEFLDLPKKIAKLVSEDNFESVLDEYKSGQTLFIQMRGKYPNNPLYPRAWSRIEETIDTYRESMFESLRSIHLESINDNFQTQISQRGVNFISIIKRIILLESEKNPIKEFIHAQYSKAALDLEKGLTTIRYDRLINARRGIINAYEMDQSEDGDFGGCERLSNTTMTKIYNIISKPNFKPQSLEESYKTIDLPLVSELWGFISQYVDDVTDSVIKKKVLKFENIYKFFMNDINTLMNNDNQNIDIELLSITEDDKLEMRTFFENVLNKICGRLEFIFTCSREDMDRAISLVSEHGKDAVFAHIEESNIESIASYGFIPPHSNAIASVHYISNMHNQIYNSLMDLHKRDHIFYSDNLDEAIIRATEKVNRNMILGSLCLLNEDMKSISLMEDWTISKVHEGSTLFPEFLLTYYQVFLTKIQHLNVFNDQALMSDTIRLFTQSLLTALDSIVANSNERSKYDPDQGDLYRLLTISNLKVMRKATIPKILKLFDTAFDQSLHLTKDLEIYREISACEQALMNDCTSPYFITIKEIIREGLALIPGSVDGANSASTRSTDVKRPNASPYVIKVFGFIVSVKSRLTKWNISKLQINEVEVILLKQFVKRVFESLNKSYSSDGAAQIALDMSLTNMVISKLNTSSSYVVDTKKLGSVISSFSSSIDHKLLEKNVMEAIKMNSILIQCILEV